MADEVTAKSCGAAGRGALAKPCDGPWPAAAVFSRGREFSKRSLPSAYHASRQPSIGLSSRVPSGVRSRLVFLQEINAGGLPQEGQQPARTKCVNRAAHRTGNVAYVRLHASRQRVRCHPA